MFLPSALCNTLSRMLVNRQQECLARFAQAAKVVRNSSCRRILPIHARRVAMKAVIQLSLSERCSTLEEEVVVLEARRRPNGTLFGLCKLHSPTRSRGEASLAVARASR